MATQSDSLDDTENSTQDDEPTLEDVHDTVRNMRVEVVSLVLFLGGYMTFLISAGQFMTEAWVASAGAGLAALITGLFFSEAHRGNGLCQRTFDLGRRAVSREPIEWHTDPEDNDPE